MTKFVTMYESIKRHTLCSNPILAKKLYINGFFGYGVNLSLIRFPCFLGIHQFSVLSQSFSMITFAG